MDHTQLNLSKGTYILNDKFWKIVIGIDYANKNFDYVVTGMPKVYNESEQKKFSELTQYINTFANKMIESKSERNFFDASLQKAGNRGQKAN